jgi:hypothetical protein
MSEESGMKFNFKSLAGNENFGRKPSLANLLWIMRQIENLEPFSKEIVRNYVLTGKMPDDWRQIVENAYGKHFGDKNPDEASHD